MAFSYTSKFVQITPYLLMEYRYADQPNPETRFTSDVGFDKLINGFMGDSVQIFNPSADSSITNNTNDNSVVKISDTSYVSLDSNSIIAFNDFSDKLTNTVDLPVVFPSNLLVVYDSIRYHIRAGYNLNNIDGLIPSIQFPDQNGKYVTVSQILIQKGTNQEYEFSPSPVTIGSAIYDKYLEIKVPNLKDMNDKYLAASDFFKPSTLAGLISQSGKGFIYGFPLRITFDEVQNIDSYDGYDRYNTSSLAILSLEQEDPFSNIGATIKESDQGQFFEYYATDNEGFIEDFILFQNSIGNSYFISHQIQVLEQIGASFIETSRFESIQTTAYDVPNFYRPIVRNSGVAASFTLRYIMSLVNNKDQSRVIRIGSYTSSNPSEWGINITPIRLSDFPQVQKIYNRVYGQQNLLNENASYPVRIVERLRYVNNIIEQNTVNTSFTNLTLSSSVAQPQDTTALGLGKTVIDVSPFENLYKFKFIQKGKNESLENLDLTTLGILKISFLEDKGEKLNISSFTNNVLANPSKGEILFKIDESNSKKILLLKDKRFFIILGPQTQNSTSPQTQNPTGSLSSNQSLSQEENIRSTLRRGIKGRSLERANLLNSVGINNDAGNSNNSVLYWGYWKASGDRSPIIPEVSVNLDITPPTPIIQRPINVSTGAPIISALGSLTPSSVPNSGAAGGNQTPPELSTLTGIALDNSVIAGIKKVFNDLSGTAPSATPTLFSGSAINIGSGGGNDSSTYVDSLVDLYSKYPQLTKIKYLGLYSKATTSIPPYTPLFINSIRLKVSSQID